MITDSKCECGHNNPVDTILCEYCGKILVDNANFQKEMRYEGRARRSRSVQSTLFNRVWAFFSSVRTAIILIIVTILAAAMGSILPQERFIVVTSTPYDFYKNNYGIFGTIFYKLGLTNLYSSWWFFSLLFAIGISLVVCSLDRIIPLYRALSNQKVIKSLDFITRQRITSTQKIESNQILKKLSSNLSRKRYTVRSQQEYILAEKGRISRFGPYINHVGLLLVLLGILLRYVPGWQMEENFLVREGQMAQISGTNLYLKNQKSNAKYYTGKDSGVPKQFQTDIVLYEKQKDGMFKPVGNGSILVNQPFEYKGIYLFQNGFTKSLKSLVFKLLQRSDNKSQGEFEVDLDKVTSEVYSVGQKFNLKVLEYYPDFVLKDRKPSSKSQMPNNPAFIFEVEDKANRLKEHSWVIARKNTENLIEENKYKVKLSGLKMINASVIMVNIDRSLPIILVGGIIVILGLVMGFYWQHRRIWLCVRDNTLYLGAHTNKNWYALRREVELISSQTGLILKLT